VITMPFGYSRSYCADHGDLSEIMSADGGDCEAVLDQFAASRRKSGGKAAILSAVPPLMVKTAQNPGGLEKKVFDDLQAQLAANR
jgi:non-heme chloroperoxidase